MQRRFDLREESVVEEKKEEAQAAGGLGGLVDGLFGGSFIWIIFIIAIIFFLFGGFGHGYGYSID